MGAVLWGRGRLGLRSRAPRSRTQRVAVVRAFGAGCAYADDASAARSWDTMPFGISCPAVWDARTASAADRSYNVVKRKYIHEFLASKADRPLPGDGPAEGGPRSNGDTTIDGDHLVRPRQDRKHRTTSAFPNVEL